MRGAGSGVRAGFSMLETVIALAVLALGAALVVGRAGQAVEQIEVHTAFQDLRTAVGRLRQEAFATETPLVLDQAQTGLPQGWTLRTPSPVTISASGDCGPTTMELLKGARVRARLVTDGRACDVLRER